MRAKFFFIIPLCLMLSLSFFTESRELSIQQLEERKRADEERKKKREKRGKKIFQKEIPGCKGQEHRIIKNAGHFIQEDQSEKLSELIIEFIRKN